jgi:hypothetical protein
MKLDSRDGVFLVTCACGDPACACGVRIGIQNGKRVTTYRLTPNVAMNLAEALIDAFPETRAMKEELN